eukprot:2266999-Pleurochrysis_carterae.AAC.1
MQQAESSISYDILHTNFVKSRRPCATLLSFSSPTISILVCMCWDCQALLRRRRLPDRHRQVQAQGLRRIAEVVRAGQGTLHLRGAANALHTPEKALFERGPEQSCSCIKLCVASIGISILPLLLRRVSIDARMCPERFSQVLRLH